MVWRLRPAGKSIRKSDYFKVPSPAPSCRYGKRFPKSGIQIRLPLDLRLIPGGGFLYKLQFSERLRSFFQRNRG
jgi:hypothetical protein